MNRRLRLLVAVLAATMAAFLLGHSDANGAPAGELSVRTYNYNAVLDPSAPATSSPERALPLWGDRANHDFVVSACPGVRRTAAIYDYDRVGGFVQAADSSGPLVQKLNAAPCSPSLGHVAANSERLLNKANRIEQHLAREGLDHSPANGAMLARIRSSASGGAPLSRADRAFMRHESTEGWLMDRGIGVGPAHRMAGWTHRTYGNYDPSVIKQFPELFNSNWFNFWGI